MALVNRISRLFKADFHAVLDQIEEPEAILKQAIRDMEDDLTSTEQQLKLCAHEQESLTARKSELENTVAEFENKLDLCFDSGKDDLARNIIRKKLETEHLLKCLTTKRTSNAKFLAEQRTVLDQNGATLESLRQKAELFAQRTPVLGDNSAGFEDTTWIARDTAVCDDEVEIAYLREKSLRSTS